MTEYTEISGNRRRARWSLERWLLLATFALTGTAFIFGVGVQWAKTMAVEAQVTALRHESVRRDVYQADQLRLSESVDRLTRTLDRLMERSARIERQTQ